MAVDGSFGVTERGDAESGEFSFFLGRESDCGGFIFSADYVDREQLLELLDKTPVSAEVRKRIGADIARDFER